MAGIGMKIEHREVMSHVLDTLPNSYNGIVTIYEESLLLGILNLRKMRESLGAPFKKLVKRQSEEKTTQEAPRSTPRDRASSAENKGTKGLIVCPQHRPRTRYHLMQVRRMVSREDLDRKGDLSLSVSSVKKWDIGPIRAGRKNTPDTANAKAKKSAWEKHK